MGKVKRYDEERDIKQLDILGGYYGRHVSAMTSEGLHRKSAIAAELGYRDSVIDALRAELAALKAKAAVPDINQLIELLERVRLSDEEANRHGNGSTYWNNAVLACQIAIRDELAAAPSQHQRMMAHMALKVGLREQAIQAIDQVTHAELAQRDAKLAGVVSDLKFLAEYVLGQEHGRSLPNYLALGRYPLDVAAAALADCGVEP